jgi:hypothetical protein
MSDRIKRYGGNQKVKEKIDVYTMPTYNNTKLFRVPKKRGRPKTAKKSRMCAPKVPYNACEAKMKDCTWVHGKKREYCRTRKNSKRT